MKAYEKYVPSGVEWIGDIPEGWDIMKFRYFFTTRTGLTITKSDLVDDGVPCVNYGEIHSKFGFDLDVMRDELRNAPIELLETQKSSLVTENDFIFCDTSEDVDGSGNYTLISNINQKKLFAGSHTIIAHPLKTAHYRYLAYLFSTVEWRSQVRKNVSGVKVFSITQGILKGTRIIFPPLETQIDIADYLDLETAKIDSIIKVKETLIERLKDKRISLITHAVSKGLDSNVNMKPSGIDWIGNIPEGWKVVPLTKYLESIVDYRGKTPEKVTSGVFLVTAKNIKNGVINYFLSQEYVDEDAYDDVMQRGKPALGDVLFTTEAPLGEVANVDDEKIALAQRVIKFRGKSGVVNNYFMKYWIMSQGFQNELQSLSTGSTALGIKASKLFQLRLMLPTYAEQGQIVKYLDYEIAKIDTTTKKMIASIDKIKEYRTSLISACVSGKIDVRGV